MRLKLVKRTVLLTFISVFLLSTILGTLHTSVKGMIHNWTSEVTVTPESPTTFDKVNVTVSFGFSSMPPFVEEFCNLTQVGNTFSINVTIIDSQIFVPIIHVDEYTYHLGSLPVGLYQFEVYVNYTFEGWPWPRLWLEKRVSFTVKPIVNFSLITLYNFHLDLNGTFYEGNNLTVVFYDYAGEYEANVTIWNTTAEHVNLSIDITHPLNKELEDITLVLTDSSGNVILKIESFLICRSHLMDRLAEIDAQWIYASLEDRKILFKEILEMDAQWPYAP